MTTLTMNEFELTGLDGGNLLGYLAALGTLRILTMADRQDETRMRWIEKDNWTPVIHHSRIPTSAELLEVLERNVSGAPIDPAWDIGDDLTLSVWPFHFKAATWAGKATASDRTTADFLTAFGSDAYGTGPKKDQMSDTEFRTMSGAGHQHFLGCMRRLAQETTGDQLARALFHDWDYADSPPALRWDPADYRPHALRAEDPSRDPIKTMRGANRLAIEALTLFPTVPGRLRVSTTGFQTRDGQIEFTWPIWTDVLDIETIRALLAGSDIQNGDRLILRRRGIAQVFRAKRFTEAKYRNFSPASALL
jgi:hypothetical protein